METGVGECTDCIVKGLDSVLMNDVRPGDGIVITTGGHTTYMLHSCGGPTRWYRFDSMTGNLECIMGDGSNAFRYAYCTAAGAVPGRSCSQTGLESSKMYTGMIMRRSESAPVRTAESALSMSKQALQQTTNRKRPSPDAAASVVPENVGGCSRQEIMANARQAIETMGGAHKRACHALAGGNVCQMLRSAACSFPVD